MDDIDIDGQRAIARMLKDLGHDTVEEWALTCGYWHDKDYDQWYDDEGYGVDVAWQACELAYEGGYFHQEDN